MDERPNPIRILHVVERMNRGGVETWLMHILRTKSAKLRIDFLVHSPEPGEFDQEIRLLGARIFCCPYIRNPLRYAQRLSQILRENEHYDIIHSHVHHFSGLVLFIAYTLGIPIRIAHSHCDSTGEDAGAAYARKLYLHLMKRLIDRYATMGLAVSARAANALRNGDCGRLKWKVLPCGIDLSPFTAKPDKALLRKEVGISDKTVVIGHVGNFVPAKNHKFIVQVACECIKLRPDCCFVLIGEGELSNTIKRQVKELALEEHFFFLGNRTDVPWLLKMMDVFIFPSISEGLGIAVIEAQAAELPIIISDAVPPEVDLVPGLLQWLSLSQVPAIWAAACIQAYNSRLNMAPRETCSTISKTPFNILYNIQEMERIYAGACNKA